MATAINSTEAKGSSESTVYDDHKEVMANEGMLEVLLAQVDAILPLEIDAIKTALRGIDSPRILDVGCGSGVFFLKLAPMLPASTKFVGIDLEPRLLEVAKAEASKLGIADRCEFLEMDACTLSLLDDDSFDLVLNRH